MRLIIIIAMIGVFAFGLSNLIEMTVQLCNTMYVAGHSVGTFLKDILN
jgi:hypothetical protein